MSAEERSVCSMLNPTLLELVAKERQRDLLANTRPRPTDEAPPLRFRERLGLSLTALGARLAPAASQGLSQTTARVNLERVDLGEEPRSFGARRLARH
jgi:hypothetical protein